MSTPAAATGADDLYPAGPAAVPANLTQATAATYRRHAWMAVAGLGGFVVVYVALSIWFGWTAYRLLHGAMTSSQFNLWGALAGACSALLAVFLVKGLFFIKRGEHADEDVEITAEQQPALFRFLHRLADEARAPRPHRVYLSARVNAAVFYDLSLLNLLLPSKKNLEIGLALVNVLSLSELKAVLAHEFGHFAQKSMAVGRWVYVAQQLAAQIVSRRDALDKFVDGLGRVDLRVAWIGWLLSLVIWSIRSLMETFFRLVILAQRALSREMEFQADLVAVSLTGSDALIHALYRLGAADEAFDRAAGFAASELRQGKPVRDLFAVQSAVIDKLALVRGEPDFGRVPPPAADAARHRLFRRELSQAPQMWATHPSNADREANAKQVYLPSAQDARSAWTLFQDTDGLRVTLTRKCLGYAADVEPVPQADSLARLDESYGKIWLDPRYRGCYIGRSLTSHAAKPAELYDAGAPAVDERALRESFDTLYPDGLRSELRQLTELEHEKAGLEGVKAGFVQPARGMVHFRGNEIPKRAVGSALEQVNADLAKVRDSVRAHDRRVRNVHLQAARKFGGGWPEYLGGLMALIHYADHTEANLQDARGLLRNVFNVVTADGKVSGRERKRLLKAADELHTVLAEVHAQAPSILPGAELLGDLGAESWSAWLGKFEFPPPSEANLGDWLNASDSWVGDAVGKLGALSTAALERLLKSEAALAGHVRDGSAPSAAPAPSQVPARYPLLLPGSERKRQTRLHFWDRFQLADGLFPAILRLAIAGAIVAAVVVVAQIVGSAHVTVYNGLARTVEVTIGGSSATLKPLAIERMSVTPGAAEVEARTREGQRIESFKLELESGTQGYVYNVASATPLVEWTANYGNAPQRAQRDLGVPRWLDSGADHLFEEPPQSVSTKGGGATRDVLTAIVPHGPDAAINSLRKESDQATLALAHARWDALDSPALSNWFGYVPAEKLPELLQERLRENPDSIYLLRFEQELGGKAGREQACARQAALTNLAEADRAYLRIRCLPTSSARSAEAVAAHARWPDHAWLALSAGFALTGQGDLDGARTAWEQARRALPSMGDYMAVELARLRRIKAVDRAADIRDLAGNSPTLQRLIAYETGKDLAGPMLAFPALAQGNLQNARTAAKGDPRVNTIITVLAAASDGAPPAWAKEALAIPPGQLQSPTLAWIALALAARQSTDPAPYWALVNASEDDELPLMRDFIEQVLARGEGADTGLLAPLTPENRGLMLSAATVMLGARTPAGWRATARTTLFPAERPYFR